MLYAQVVLGLPVDGPFDYGIPDSLTSAARVGCRVKINFRNKKEIGYIVALSDKTSVKTVKPVIDVIDRSVPLLSEAFLGLAMRLSLYYYCSWGEAIEIGLPMALRTGRVVDLAAHVVVPLPAAERTKSKRFLIHDQDGDGRIRVYGDRAASYLQQQRSVIVLVPDKDAIGRMHDTMEARFPGLVRVLVREGTEEIRQWLLIRNSPPCILIGTRSAVFAPAQNLGCVIIDDEHDYGYKQDQSPHYHAREAAMMRCDIEGADFIAGSIAPSLEMMHAVASGTIALHVVARGRPYPEIKVVDMKKLPLVSTRQRITISGFLQDAILASLAAKGKILLFMNRKGYATLAICSHCGKIFQCPRCNVNLNFHYEANMMRCHYCNYTAEAPKICPECNSGYVRFLGAGAEKLESELCRVFPQARIARWESGTAVNFDHTDIFIATQAGIRHLQRRFDLVGVLGIDNALNHVDFRASEKTYGVITSLAGLADSRMVVQTNMVHHHVFKALTLHSSESFYDEEFLQRKQLLFPPYRHFGLVKLRGKDEGKVEKAAHAVFDSLSEATKPAGIEMISVNPAPQAKLRGNFYWNILTACTDTMDLHDFLKKNLTKQRHSGIIVTVDIDPV